MYGHYYSPQTISVITKQLDEKVKEYHSRKITKDYVVVYADSTYISVKRGTVGKEALYILIGITISGEKEILSYELFPTESPENYKDILEDIKKRGLRASATGASEGTEYSYFVPYSFSLTLFPFSETTVFLTLGCITN